ncbi:MAG: NYN domain-containing protein [Oscillospiraceae bacterium]|jgi:uncharacterized LabA/DUF88 family protein|nr:NYN domain-containing protein [Oscillospiraceae bacterium]
MPKIVTAVFYDMENLVGGEGFRYEIDFKRIAQEIKSIQVEKNELNIIAAFAYANWSNAKYDSIKHLLPGLGIQAIHTKAFNYEQRQKNLADIQLSLDALALFYDSPHVETFVVVSGDGCYSLLAEKLRFGLKKVVCVGFADSFSHVLRESCDVSVTLNAKLRTDLPPSPPQRPVTAPHFRAPVQPQSAAQTRAPAKAPTTPSERELTAFVLEQAKKAGKEPLRLSALQSAMCAKFPAADYRKLTGAKLAELLEPLLKKTAYSVKTKGLRRVIAASAPSPLPAPGSGAIVRNPASTLNPALTPAAQFGPAPHPVQSKKAEAAPKSRYDFTGFTAVPNVLNLKTLETFAENVLIWLKEKNQAERVELKEFYDLLRTLEPRVQYTDYGFFDHQQFLLFLLSRKKQRVVRDSYGNRFILLRPPLENEKVQHFNYQSAGDYTLAQVKKAVGLLGTDLPAIKNMLDRLIAASWLTRPKKDFFDEYVLPYSGQSNGGLFMHVLGSLVLITWKNDVVTRAPELAQAQSVGELLPFLMQGVRKKVGMVTVPEEVFSRMEGEMREGFALSAVSEGSRHGGGLFKKLFK